MRLITGIVTGALLLNECVLGKIYKVAGSDDPKNFEPIPPNLGGAGGGGHERLSRLLEEKKMSRVFRTNGGVRIEAGGDVDGVDAADEEVPCYYPEVVLVQDVSDSFKPNIKNMEILVPKIFEFFDKRFGGKAKFAITTFVDKPIAPWGYSNDFCLWVDMPLRVMDNRDVIEEATDIFSRLDAGGGLDYLDAGQDAIYRTVLSNAVGWNEASHDPVTGKPILRIVILVTDAALHEAGYHAQKIVEAGYMSEPLAPCDLMNYREELNADPELNCTTVDVPTPKQLAEALRERNVVPLVFAGQPLCEEINDFWPQYVTDVIKRYPDHPEFDDIEAGVAAYYRYYFNELVGTDVVVHTIDSGSKKFVETLEAAMADVTELTCLRPTEVPTQAPAPPVDESTEKTTTTEVGEEETTKKDDQDEEETTTMQEEVNESTTKKEEEAETTKMDEGEGDETNAADDDEQDETSNAGGNEIDGEDSDGSSNDEDSDEEEEEESKGGSTAAIVGAASGGAAAAAAAGLFAAKKMGMLFNNTSGADMGATQDVDNVDINEDREQFEAVTGDLFA